MRLLMVEDDRELASVVKAGLENDRDTNFEVDNAYTLAEGLHKLEHAGQYGCVILDIKLPNGRGTTLIERWQGRSPETPFVVVSGDDTVTAGDVILRGAQDFLRKPVGVKRLIEAIFSAAARHQVRGVFAPIEAKLDAAEEKSQQQLRIQSSRK